MAVVMLFKLGVYMHTAFLLVEVQVGSAYILSFLVQTLFYEHKRVISSKDSLIWLKEAECILQMKLNSGFLSLGRTCISRIAYSPERPKLYRRPHMYYSKKKSLCPKAHKRNCIYMLNFTFSCTTTMKSMSIYRPQLLFEILMTMRAFFQGKLPLVRYQLEKIFGGVLS